MMLHYCVPRRALTVLAVAGILLSACASVPPGAPVRLDGGSGTKFNTGRVSLFLTDFSGRALNKAMVNVESVGEGEYFRTAAWSDVWGRVSFAGLPEQVRISVFHAESLGSYSREFVVPSSGTTELRMMIEPGL